MDPRRERRFPRNESLPLAERNDPMVDRGSTESWRESGNESTRNGNERFFIRTEKRYNTFSRVVNKQDIAREIKRKSSKEKSRTRCRDTSLSRFWQAKHFSKYTRSPLTAQSIFAY